MLAWRDLLPPRVRSGVDRPSPPALRDSLAELDRLARARPALAEASASLGQVLRAVFCEPLIGEIHADPQILIAAWRAGVPAFRAGETPPGLDQVGLRERASAVCRAVSKLHPDAARLASAFDAEKVRGESIWHDTLAGREDEVEDRARALGVDPALMRSVLRLALLPALAAHSDQLARHFDESIWSRGDCPNCGSPSLLAESRGLERRRFLRCGLCAADWPFDRLKCPDCGEDDHRRLSHRYFEGEQERHRLCCCETCGGRLKVIATLGRLSAPNLLVAELASASLDAL